MPGEVHVGEIVSVGYALSSIKDFLIPSGEDGSAVDPIVFDRHYSFFSIWCEDASGIDSATKMSFKVAYTSAMEPVQLYQQNQPGTAWESTNDLPTSGGFAFQLTEAIGIKKLQILLDTPTIDPVVICVMGIKQASG